MEKQTENKPKQTKGTISYQANGLVLGKINEDSLGAYPSKQFIAPSKKRLLFEVAKSIKDGSLGVANQGLEIKGALLEILKTTTLEIDGKWFTNQEVQRKAFGRLDVMDQEFLQDCMEGELV